MIPQFPQFKKVSLDDKDEITTFVSAFEPYSDFNFTSLYSYNTLEKAEVSYLNGNLVMKFYDYITLKPFFTFLGQNNIKETIHILLEHAKENNVDPALKLIPSVVIDSHPDLHDAYTIVEDPDNHDYMLSVDELSNLTGNNYRGKRNFVNRFHKLYPDHKNESLDLTNENVQNQIRELFYLWAKQQGKSNEETVNEYKAIDRLLKASGQMELLAHGVFHDGRLIGFSINEKLHGQHGIIHFEKADLSYTGVFQHLKHQTAKHFKDAGYTYLNYEQDLGEEGLRKAKKSWQPTHFLKKYTISHKTL